MISPDEQFTLEFSSYLNTFIKDLANDQNKVLAKVDDFTGDRQTVRQAILNGPSVFEKTDIQTCKTLLNFIEFYCTGRISRIDVEVPKNVITR